MRLVGAAFLVVLASLPALADDAKPADQKPTETRAHVPLRVVRMLPDAGQALLFDRTKGTYVAVEAGQTVEGFTVDTVDDDEVTLVSDAGATVVLAAPARHHRLAEAGNGDDADSAETERPVRHHARPARVAAVEPKPADPYATEASPADPYADATTSGEAQPSDPYGDGVEAVPAGLLGTGADGVRVADAAAPVPAAVIGTGADGVRVASAAPAPAAVAAPAPVAAPAAAPAPATVTVTFTAPAPVAAPAAVAVAAPTVAAAPVTAPPAVVAPTTTRPPTTARKPATKSADDGVAALAAALTGEDAPAEMAATAPTAAPMAGAIILARADVRAALSNFGALTKSVQGGFTADGLRIDSVVAGSLFAKAGLQPGDVVTSVDGKPLRSLDDAANLYARASKARTLTAQVLRGGAPVALRVSIQ